MGKRRLASPQGRGTLREPFCTWARHRNPTGVEMEGGCGKAVLFAAPPTPPEGMCYLV